MPIEAESPEYEIALSFAGSERAFVEDVARALQADGIKVFYDASDDEEIRLWGLDLAEEFHRVYSNASLLVAMFVSEQYLERSWTRHERRSAIERALQEKREFILPIHFDDTRLPGIPATLGHLPAGSLSPQDVVAKIERKLVQLGVRLPSAGRPTSEWVSEGSRRQAGSITVNVKNSDGSDVADARVGVVRSNGTAIFASTNTSGCAEISLVSHELVSVWVAHPSYPPVLVQEHNSQDDVEVRLLRSSGVSGIIFETSTGYIPGLKGRFAPILSRGQQYVYADNLSINGAAAQPAHFALAEPLGIEDSNGIRVLLTFVAMTGNHSLIKYEKGEEKSL